MMNRAAILFLLLTVAVLPLSAQRRTKAHPRNGKGIIGAGRVGTGAISQNWQVAPDLSSRLAKYKVVRMPLTARLSPRERQMVEKLVEASNYLEQIYWRQSDPEALTLYRQLQGSTNTQDEKLRRFLFINAGRYDLIGENRTFLGTEPMRPGRALYPSGLTRAEVEAYVKAHPDKKKELYSGYTVVRRMGDELVGLPYHDVFRPYLVPAAKALREAALLSPDPHFANFLRLRADGLLSDNYYDSDIVWLDLQNPRFDVVFAPYETYLDDLLGVKTSYGAAILIRNEAESRKLAIFQQFVPDIQDSLPLAPEDRPSKKGQTTSMEVVDSPFRTGDFNHGYQAVADSLPNDPLIIEKRGSKKIFFKNFMDVRVNEVILPLAKRLMQPDQAAIASGEGYLAHTMMHEIAHALGPAYSRVNGKQVDIREAMGPLYSGLEEAKADVVGMLGLIWLCDHGHLPAAKRNEYFASYLAGNFRTMRFGATDAHGMAETMEFNYLLEKGVYRRDPATGRYSVDYAAMAPATTALARELLEQEATGDRARAEAWFAKYSKIPADLEATLKRQADIPVDITPVFSFPVKVQ